MSNYDTLIAILIDARKEYVNDRTVPPVACPNDGTPLLGGPGGVLYCPFDGWQYPRDRRLGLGDY